MKDLTKLDKIPEIVKNMEFGDYEYSKDGINRKIVDKNGNSSKKVVSNTPVFINYIIKDIESNTEKISLIYYKYKKWNTTEIRKSVISSKNEIIQLSECGIHVTSSTAKELVEYLSELEHLNNISYVLGTDKFGWQR